MRRFLFIAVGVSALLTPAVMFPAHTPASITGGEIFAAFAFYPCFIFSVIGLIAGLADIVRSRDSRGSGVLLAVLALVLPATMVAKKLNWEANYDASYAWFDQAAGGGLINFFLYRYVREHPSAVTYVSDDSEEVQVSGFIDSLRAAEPLYMRDHSNRKHKVRITSEGVFTPWGSRIHFAVDRNHDGFLTAAGQRGSTRYGVADPWAYDKNYSYSFATGVFLTLPDPKLSQTDSSFVTVDNNDYDRVAPSLFAWLQQK
jgi:hypothetical protein